MEKGKTDVEEGDGKEGNSMNGTSRKGMGWTGHRRLGRMKGDVEEGVDGRKRCRGRGKWKKGTLRKASR